MAFEVANVPWGLSALLNLKDRGRNPQLLSEIYAPVIDALPFLMANQYEKVSSFGTVALGGMNILTVPAGEVWYVHTIGANVAAPLGAGVTIRICTAYTLRGAVALTPLGPYQTFAPGENLAIGASGPLILGPGGILGALVASLAGAGPTLDFAACIARLRV